VAYVHEVLMDSEMEMIMDHGKGHMERSKVGQSVNSTTTEIRTSQNTWLWYESNPWLSKIKQRLEDVTGLSTESAEPLQLVNYGIGGQYEPHFDFMDVSLSSYSDEELIEMFFFSQDDGHAVFGWKGNRLLTALFYVSFMSLWLNGITKNVQKNALSYPK